MQNYLIVGLVALFLGGCTGQVERSHTPLTEFAAGPCEVGIFGSDAAFVAITRREDFQTTIGAKKRGQ